MRTAVRTWHYGLVARWWGEFNEGGDDVEFFRQAIAHSGEPALDAGCGTGRLLLPFVRAGMDVDGSDASRDMLDQCGARAESEGIPVKLYPQAMHELDLPRRYRTIIVCGAFGLGGTRADDLEGLRRIHAHLEPSGTLVLDHYRPRAEERDGKAGDAKPTLPQNWPLEGDRRRAADGSELELRSRLLSFDPAERTLTREISVRQFVDDKEVASESYSLDICIYSKSDLEQALSTAGFGTIRITGGLEERPARAEDERIVFHASA